MPFTVFKSTNEDKGKSKNNFPTLYYVNFVKTKQEELIHELQKEIEKLRHENSGKLIYMKSHFNLNVRLVEVRCAY
jgi:hypothetical protein